MTLPFIGRKQELETLRRLLTKNVASLVVIRGRRRIGKSRLIQEFAKDYKFCQFSGWFCRIYFRVLCFATKFRILEKLCGH